MADLSLEQLAKRIAEAVLYYGDSRGYATRRITKELAAAEERGRKAGRREMKQELANANAECRAERQRALRAERAAGYDCAP